MAHDVFIAYSSHDRNIVSTMAAFLRNKGISCWAFHEDIQPGEEFAEAIFSAMSGCKVFMVVLSSHTSTSMHIEREIEFAFRMGKTVVPIRTDQAVLATTLSIRLDHCESIDATARPFESNLSRLLEAIQSALSIRTVSSKGEPPGVLARIDSAIGQIQAGATAPSVPPEPSMRNEEYIFVSYKRDDLPRITPFLVRLRGWGYDIWYDRGIPGGAEWDTLIEEKVTRCKVLLVFLSQAAVESKWVRREIKFADSENKPILGIRLDKNVELKHGLKVVMNQYQMIDASDADFSDQLQKAIQYVRLL